MAKFLWKVHEYLYEVYLYEYSYEVYTGGTVVVHVSLTTVTRIRLRLRAFI